MYRSCEVIFFIQPFLQALFVCSTAHVEYKLSEILVIEIVRNSSSKLYFILSVLYAVYYVYGVGPSIHISLHIFKDP